MVFNGWVSNINRGKNVKISIVFICVVYGFSLVL